MRGRNHNDVTAAGLISFLFLNLKQMMWPRILERNNELIQEQRWQKSPWAVMMLSHCYSRKATRHIRIDCVFHKDISSIIYWQGSACGLQPQQERLRPSAWRAMSCEFLILLSDQGSNILFLCHLWGNSWARWSAPEIEKISTKFDRPRHMSLPIEKAVEAIYLFIVEAAHAGVAWKCLPSASWWGAGCTRAIIFIYYIFRGRINEWQSSLLVNKV